MFIRPLREKASMTQVELADKVNVSERTVLRWEAGHREPRASDIAKLCEVLGCSEGELLNGPAGSEIVVKIRMQRKEVEGMNIELDMTGNDLVQSVTFAGEKIGLGIVYGGDKTLRDVCDTLLRHEAEFERMRKGTGQVAQGVA